ncbi:MAG: proline iminopeptidase-family hydrolase [Lewinellaceae bacterium]|nr:proline iminopeptidase-family hydrolase [Lewinellaceae bacterium]
MTRPIKKHLLLLLLALSFQACNNTAQETHSTEIDLNAYLSPVGDGVQSGGVQVIPIETMGKTFHVWTKRIGNNPTHKLLLLHGGPGATHEYFECLESFFPKEGIELIYYDQLGSGNSDNPDDVSFWDLPRFVDELEQVRKALGLNQDNFFLLGHSWGGILAMEYALKYQDNLKGLIISNMMASAPEYDKYADEVLAKQLKPEVLDTIRMLEANNDFGNPKYMELLMPNFYAEHICRIPIEDWPEPILRSFAKLNQSLYVTMQGPSEFGLSGKLEKWDRTADLPKITVPTLTIGGQYDTMDPEHMKRMATQVKDGTYLYCPNGSHMSMWDDQKTWMDGVISFIQVH